MATPSTEPDSKPPREKLLPQASLRFFLLLIGFSALIMVVYRIAFTGEGYAPKLAALLFTIIVACFGAYAALFFLANLFSVTTRPFRSALGYDSERQDATVEEK